MKKRCWQVGFLLFVPMVGTLLLGGCSSMGVQPWERGTLAKESMILDNRVVDDAFDDHIYFSKEASSGGRGFGGGGCGCN